MRRIWTKQGLLKIDKFAIKLDSLELVAISLAIRIVRSSRKSRTILVVTTAGAVGICLRILRA